VLAETEAATAASKHQERMTAIWRAVDRGMPIEFAMRTHNHLWIALHIYTLVYTPFFPREATVRANEPIAMTAWNGL
jgi:hypothetical protein